MNQVQSEQLIDPLVIGKILFLKSIVWYTNNEKRAMRQHNPHAVAPLKRR